MHDNRIEAIFNTDAEQPDHARQAVRAALTLRETLPPGEPPLIPGSAVHLGDAIIGPLGTQQTRTIGSALDITRQLQARVQPGQILISTPVHTNLGDAITDEEAGTLALEGQDKPLKFFEIKNS